MPARITLGDIAVDVLFKDIKNVHLVVHPPHGHVTISAPARMDVEAIRAFALTKLSWIRQQQRRLQEQPRETEREFLDRESHFVWGQRYLLRVVPIARGAHVELDHQIPRLLDRQVVLGLTVAKYDRDGALHQHHGIVMSVALSEEHVADFDRTNGPESREQFDLLVGQLWEERRVVVVQNCARRARATHKGLSLRLRHGTTCHNHEIANIRRKSLERAPNRLDVHA